MPETILSCDWGTTNVRLRRVEVASRRILERTDSDRGVKVIHAEWSAAGGDRSEFYIDALRALFRDVGHRHSDRALVVSGMASSSIGIMELPYARMPFRLDGSDLIREAIDIPGLDVPLMLLSGIRSTDDAMRGEETELIGLHATTDMPRTAIVLLPGTHCKHVHVRDGCVTAFQTYMTGELFELLATASILRDSVETAPFDAQAFEMGLRSTEERDLGAVLFTARTNLLFDRLDAGENYWYLSGILIGSELRSLLEADVPIVVGGSSRLATAYRTALEILTTGRHECFMLPDVARDRAAVDGHLEAYRVLFGAADGS